MPKTTKQLRSLETDELSAHDVVSLMVLTGLSANPSLTDDASEIDVTKLIQASRKVADEFLKQREESQNEF